MNSKETAQVLQILNTAYPAAFKNMPPDERKAQFELWSAMFKTDTAETVAAALENYIAGNEYPPSIAGLKKEIKRLTGESDYEHYWHEAEQAIIGNRKFSELSLPVQKWFGTQQGIDQIGNDTHTIMSVTRGQFMNRIGEIVKNEQALKGLPNNLKQLVSKTVKELSE